MKHPKNIDRIGAEMEGGWNESRVPGDIYADGSVVVPAWASGEVCSPPLLMPALEAWIREKIPDHVNASCGYHIHISTKNKHDYQLLMTKKFFNYFLKRAHKWGKTNVPNDRRYWDRLAGNNSYCTRRFDPDTQSVQTGKNSCRYSILNYCYALHGTLECRLFPMFKNQKTACAAMRFFARTCSGFIERERVAERKNSVEKVVLDDEEDN